MKLIKGNLWDSSDRLILITANSFIKKDGSLAMGRGAALEAKERYRFIDIVAGSHIQNRCGHLGVYGVDILGWFCSKDVIETPKQIGLFQTKIHFKNDSNLDLIVYSATYLKTILDNKDNLLMDSVSINFPGIGNGNLKPDDVLNVLEDILDDRVTLYEK